jgi:hypothetical protein
VNSALYIFNTRRVATHKCSLVVTTLPDHITFDIYRQPSSTPNIELLRQWHTIFIMVIIETSVFSRLIQEAITARPDMGE